MVTLKTKHTAKKRLAGRKRQAIIGVVASGNLEVLLTCPARQDMRNRHQHDDERVRRRLESRRGRFRRAPLARRASHLDQRRRCPA